MPQVISERIKASSMQKLLMEEKDLLHSQIASLEQEKSRLAVHVLKYVVPCNEYLRMSEVMARMEERERNHEATVLAMDKDLALKQQAMDALKKKVRER